MSIELSVEIKGLEELISEIKELPKNIGLNALRSAVRASAVRVKKRAQQNTDLMFIDPTGRLKKAIKAKGRKGYLARRGFFLASAYVPIGETRGDVGGAYYAHMVEYGHRLVRARSNKKKGYGVAINGNYGSVAPKPFLRNALRQEAPSILNEFSSNIRAEVEKRISKLKL